MSWLDTLLEAAEEEVTDVITKAIDSKDAQGITNISKANKNVLDNEVSDDPDSIMYDKTNTYSQHIDIGDEGIDGTIDSDRDDTETKVKSGAPTSQITEALFTRDEMQQIYSECVAETIQENAEEIKAKFNEKIAAAKEWKAKKLAQLKAKKNKEEKEKKATKEAARINAMLDEIFSDF